MSHRQFVDCIIGSKQKDNFIHVRKMNGRELRMNRILLYQMIQSQIKWNECHCGYIALICYAYISNDNSEKKLFLSSE